MALACEANLDPIEVPMNCPDMPVRGPTAAAADVPLDQLIDDFDDGDTSIVQVADRDGYWVFNPVSSSITAHNSNDCAARDSAAGHFKAAGFGPNGANWTAYFLAPGPATAPNPYNAQALGYTGFSFWAAIGTGRAPFPLNVGVSTMDTIPTFGAYYGATVELTHSWQRFVVPFSDLVQTTTKLDPTPLRLEALVDFIVWPEQGQFDIWIDDLRFEK
jgi:hypothetical protein